MTIFTKRKRHFYVVQYIIVMGKGADGKGMLGGFVNPEEKASISLAVISIWKISAQFTFRFCDR